MTVKKLRLKRTSSLYKQEKWKKNLYENQGYPDNYTDTSFLEELQKNVHVGDVSFLTAVLGAGLITQQICIVVLFALVFVHLYNGWVEPETVFVQSSLATAAGYLVYQALFMNQNYYESIIKDMRTVLTFLVFGYVLSPILKTLTDTISTDTIYAMTTFMMCIHIIFFDYGVSASIVSSSLSLNAAIFGSVCLTSRLASPFHAFVLLTNAVEFFVLLPILLAKGQTSLSVLIAIVIVTLWSLWTVSVILCILLALTVVFITVLCPVWFLRWQRYKDNIYGPWDEAIVHDADL